MFSKQTFPKFQKEKENYDTKQKKHHRTRKSDEASIYIKT